MRYIVAILDFEGKIKTVNLDHNYQAEPYSVGHPIFPEQVRDQVHTHAFDRDKVLVPF
jgi:hypothetical protein